MIKKVAILCVLAVFSCGAVAATGTDAGRSSKTKVSRTADKAVKIKRVAAKRHDRLANKSRSAARVSGKASPRVISQEDIGKLNLQSTSAMVFDESTGQSLFAKNTDTVQPIASITKLMTAILVLEKKLPMDEEISIEAEDVDTLKGTRSRLAVGTVLTRREMLRLALMASENRAASALARTAPGGMAMFVAEMNRKARELGMLDTRFVEPTGLSSENVSTAKDLVHLVEAGNQYDLIRDFSTTPSHEVEISETGRNLVFRNTNALVKSKSWDISLSKTGYINEAGRCLVMRTVIAGRDIIIVLLDSWGKNTRIGDANRVRKWMESRPPVRYTMG